MWVWSLFVILGSRALWTSLTVDIFLVTAKYPCPHRAIDAVLCGRGGPKKSFVRNEGRKADGGGAAGGGRGCIPRRSERLSRGRLGGYVSFLPFTSICFQLLPSSTFLPFTYAVPALHKIRQLSGSVLLVFTSSTIFHRYDLIFHYPLPTFQSPLSQCSCTLK